MNTKPALFISYRRTRLPQVLRIKDFLEQAGIDCFLDVEDIDPLADFPERIREAIGRSHAFLAWWSADYGESGYCIQEFRQAWQHARRRSSDLPRRIWIVNPEARADHVFSGELDGKNFLNPPVAGGEVFWARALLKRFQDLNLIPEGPLADEREAPPVPIFYGVPEKSREFTGRGPEFMRIHSKLHPARVGDQGAAVAVQTFGLGGVGKTELATAYARDFAPAYPGGVYWLNLAGWHPGSPAQEVAAELAWLRALEQTFRLQPENLSRLARDSEGKELPTATVRERLAKQLSDGGDYLWILDNLPELSPLDVRTRILQFLRAPNRQGHTLLTTRDSRPAEGFAAEPLEVLSEEDALRLLTKYRPKHALGEIPAMRQLITEVGAHTQALMLLGEHARNEPGGYPDALKRLEDAGSLRRIDEIAQRLRGLLGLKARGIVATFALSIESLAEAAKELLSLASVCTPNLSIPDALLAKVFGPRADDFNLALGSLLRASLLQRKGAADRGVVIHPLVAEATVSLLEADTRALQRRLADGLLDRLTAADAIRDHTTMLSDIDQARALGGKLEEQRGVKLLLQVGQFEHGRGQYAAARTAETQALDLARRVLGAKHVDTLTSMNNLASTMRAQGDLSTARALLEQKLKIGQYVLGEEHPSTLASMNNLGSTLRAQGEFSAARALLTRVLATSRRVLGEEHLGTLTSMNTLAAIEKDLGDYDTARALEERVLSTRRRVLGEEHPATLTIMNNLASTIRAQGNPGTARALQEQTLSISRRVLGEEHPHTLASMHNLAETLSALGDHGAARALQEKTLLMRQRVLGEEHPATLASMNNLAATMGAVGDYSTARALYEQALAICRRLRGEEHPATLTMMNNLASTLQALGDYAARALQEQTLLLRRRVLGEEHPDTSNSACNLLSTLLQVGDKVSALQLLQSELLWLQERDPSSLDADQRAIRAYISEIRNQLSE